VHVQNAISAYDERADLGFSGSEDRGTVLLGGNAINRHDDLPA
jgi:hypothetical protein